LLIVSKSKTPLLVDGAQSTFIKDRFILDSVAAAQEILIFARQDQTDAIFIKFDFEKAFDSGVGCSFWNS